MSVVWLIERRAIYCHGILGVFATAEEAKRCAETAVATPSKDWWYDGDGHHVFVLMRCELGQEPVDVEWYRAERKVNRGLATYHWERHERL